ncbi:MAG TPA: tetratricopeptide repeat protein [Polyangiales bacterium]|nr:tetratricopeptide repeat protein [Polyangiales bacterium]
MCALAGTLHVLCAPVLAEPATPAPREDAMRAPTPPAGAVAHYERGRKEYLAGRYREALLELKQALALDPNSPNLVYNVARVNEDLGEFDEAIKYYRRYRDLLPEESEEREKTATTIRRLQGAKDETQQRLERERLAAGSGSAQPAPAPSGGRADAAFWIVASTGLALAAGGGIAGYMALDREKQVSDFVVGKDGTVQDREQLKKDANELALAADVLFVAAGTAVLSAAVLFFSRSSEPGKIEARVSIAPQGAALGLSGRF